MITERANYYLNNFKRPLSHALSYFILARAYEVLNDQHQAETFFQQAIQDAQKANIAHHIATFYIYRADFYLTQTHLEKAAADLNSAWEVIERCGMKLYAVDYLLIHGRYCLATADLETALNHYEEAKQLIEETGYHLRDAELDLFAALCCQRHGNIAGKPADFYMQKAKARIEEIGQWGLMPRWEKVTKGEIA
jgi:tetratricopeptide (TPR) repeat protein